MKSWCYSVIIIAIVISNENGFSEGYRYLGMVPLNGKSHFVMSEQLFKGLARKGHQVDVVGHFPLKKPYTNYRDLTLAGSLPNVVNNMTHEFVKTFGTFNMNRFLTMTGDQICQLLSHPVLQDIIKNKPKYDAIIVEIFASHCFLALGRHLNIPMIGIITTSWLDWLTVPLGHPHNPAFMPTAFTKQTHPMSFWHRLKNIFLVPMINAQFHYGVEKQLDYVHKYIGKNFSSIYELHEDIALLLTNSHYSLNSIKSFSPGIVEVGGLHIRDEGLTLPPEIQKWLDGAQHGCVYISFGSMIRIESFPKEMIDVFYKTMEKLAPIRFLLKIAKKEELPAGLPSNAITYHWFPQINVLQHKNIKAFVTHGGLMGTLEAITAGVPMVGFPLFGDQHVNLNVYVNRKIAVCLDYTKLTIEDFYGALKTVLTNPEYRENIKRISKLYYERPQPAMDTATYWIEYVTRNGNILQSPAMHMPWWQVALIDVYGFVLLCLIIAFCVLRLIVKKMCRLFCSKTKVKSTATTSSKKKN